MVAQRTREIGIRVALGSSAENVFRIVLREGALMLALDVVLGVAGTLVLPKYLESMLLGVKPADPALIAFVAGILTVVA